MHVEKFKDYEKKTDAIRGVIERYDTCGYGTEHREELIEKMREFVVWILDEIDYAKSATCQSCEMITGDVLPYILKDDLHGNKNVRVRWCHECHHAHTQGLDGCADTGTRLEVEPMN